MAKNKEEKNIDATLDAIRVKFGEDSIMKLGDKPKVGVDAISTGSIGLDAALGVGGLPRGRIIEIFGQDHFIAPRHSRSTKSGRYLRLYRRRTCYGPRVF